MSTLFSQKLSRNNEIRPREAIFTEVLEAIPLKPKMLYFYGKMPENRSKNVVKLTTNGAVDEARKRSSERVEKTGKMYENVTENAVESLAQVDINVQERPKCVAIVGTRKPTAYGAKIAHELAFEAAKRGAVVVSGLAYGIDSIAHRGALEAGGVTVAVLGTPIDQIYPRAHTGLAEEIVAKGGCVMSEVPARTQVGEEYLPGVKYYTKTCFLQRNRLIAGLADVVVIPEAAERSGSLNTAAHALEQGREVLAVPGDIVRPMSMGCNRLIRQGAMPYLGVTDVLDLLFPPVRQKRRAQQMELIGDTPLETAILAALRDGLEEGETIRLRLDMAATEFSQNLTMLEIKGRVRALGMNRWALC